ncbi:50S ribosomal protein L4 [Aureibacter tunicatorum]|uniref:Large ribosomal subunit protein uL4 n=1 Tax=Aureibacter tunicatorum TaxID=866807 RepID=A0AAE3XJE2_9BACT|nr:50S ribosomal protein L4 [Aureibacter tunicatorum]MDR6237962.1 large subunit ribosomal protein L4 [Aureibacter tunicatorum]BDD02995.1 50S ribosomal protein L4 [Aureibacter tunicatorum]
MELAVLKSDGSESGRKVSLVDSVFSVTPNDHAIYLDVKQYLANQRQGTHKSKERAEIAGSTKKIKKQKGTGTARAGSIKSPLFRGGGRVFGPEPRDYGFKLNKKVKTLARKSALSYKASENNIIIIEDVNLDAPKTKAFVAVLKSLSLAGKKVLTILPESNENVYLASRNLKNSKVSEISSINTYDVLNADSLVLFESSVEKFENLFA